MNRKLHAHIISLHQSANKPAWARWLSDLYVDIIPQAALWRLLDLYIVNGWRALFQLGLTLLTKFSKDILRLETLPDFESFFHADSHIYSDSPTVLQQIFDASLKLNVHFDIGKNIEHHPTLANLSNEDLTVTPTQRFQRGLPKFINSLMGSSKVEPAEGSTQKLEKIDLLATSTVIQSDYWIALWSWM
jgi:hypothetical protein